MTNTKLLLDSYLDQVCAYVKNKEAHQAIRLELESHLLDIVDEQVALGVQTEEAVRMAIRRTGNPAELGARYHQAHKPRMEWGMPALAACMIGIGTLTMYGIEQSGMYADASLLMRHIVFGAIGLLLMAIGALLDYRKLKAYSVHMHVGVMAAMTGTLLFGTVINGRPYLPVGPVTLDVIGLSPLLLLAAAAGIVSSDWWRSKPLLTIGLFALPPCFMYISHPSLTSLVIYVGGFAAMAVYAYRSWKPLLGLLAAVPAALALLLTTNVYKARLLTIFQAQRDPDGAGYLVTQSMELIRGAGWLGQGLGAVADRLPMVHSELLFSYIVYCFGWLGGAVVCGIVLAFLLRFATVWTRIGDRYGAMITLAMLVAFFIQFVWSIMMALGLLPITGYSLPFMSAGGATLTLQLALIGLVIGIARRRHYHIFVI